MSSLDPYLAKDLTDRLNKTVKDINEMHNLLLGSPSPIVKSAGWSVNDVQNQPLPMLLQDPILKAMYSRGYSDALINNQQVQSIQFVQKPLGFESSNMSNRHDISKNASNKCVALKSKTNVVTCEPLSDNDFYGTYT
ncbi:uncharacterized protein LOC126895065 [Daktulosphaira vitifoliae]|uniref:uncharacterized protein LOC126895065 n=1 Tax=Daktulosphaira vitifoliae TaxID=58002 RepID=UPI0021A9C076|nr:uncharacterized protein LOC126895065 [Daktulosphaira vitifoliae]XP_050522493.1 uncharacterized protein LOC126895065 [Daktulosphaira vitifoliae]